MQIDIINCDGCDTLTNCQALYHNDVWVMSLCYVCQPWVRACTVCHVDNWEDCDCYYAFGGEGGLGDMKVAEVSA